MIANFSMPTAALILFLSASFPVSTCFADGAKEKGKESWEYPADSSEFAVEKPDPNAVEKDARPAYPGEQQNIGKGKTVKRWSTRGPVEVAPAPQPFDQIENRRVPAIGGIIVDSDRSRK